MMTRKEILDELKSYSNQELLDLKQGIEEYETNRGIMDENNPLRILHEKINGEKSSVTAVVMTQLLVEHEIANRWVDLVKARETDKKSEYLSEKDGIIEAYFRNPHFISVEETGKMTPAKIRSVDEETGAISIDLENSIKYLDAILPEVVIITPSAEATYRLNCEHGLVSNKQLERLEMLDKLATQGRIPTTSREAFATEYVKFLKDHNGFCISNVKDGIIEKALESAVSRMLKDGKYSQKETMEAAIALSPSEKYGDKQIVKLCAATAKKNKANASSCAR